MMQKLTKFSEALKLKNHTNRSYQLFSKGEWEIIYQINLIKDDKYSLEVLMLVHLMTKNL